MSKPLFVMSCIDFRYNNLTGDYFKRIGEANNYFDAAVAGSGALPYGYLCYCKCKCCKKGCNPNNETMELFKKNLDTNLSIAQTLTPIQTIYLLAHQDCGAMKAFLKCSGYPETVGSNNAKEIQIYADLLTYAKQYANKKFPNLPTRIGVIDINGTVADYNTITKQWTVISKGPGTDPKGLWYNY